MKKFLCSGAISLALAGCLPVGEPPPGNVVVNTLREPESREELRERMTSELTMALMTLAPGESFALVPDAASAADLMAAVQRSAVFTGIRLTARSKWQLKSAHISGKWQVDILCGNKLLQQIILPLPH
jgi:hypothetical protein